MRSDVIDMTGRTFGRWTVMQRIGRKGKSTMWECKCSCGIIKHICGGSLRRGQSLSCGCLQMEITSMKNKKHGMSRKPEYSTYNGMIGRCTNPNDKDYEKYGLRGIYVCEEWKNDFSSFYRDMGPKPHPEYSLDRIDVNGNYEPSNCRWAPPIVQANNKRDTIILCAFGEEKTLREWSNDKRCKVAHGTLYQRIHVYKWDAEKAITNKSIKSAN